MGKLLTILALLAVSLAALAAFVMNYPLGTEVPSAITVPKAVAALDQLSFALGFVAGVITLWICRLPVSAMKNARLRWEMRRSFNWRRRFAFAALVALGAAALLLR